MTGRVSRSDDQRSSQQETPAPPVFEGCTAVPDPTDVVRPVPATDEIVVDFSTHYQRITGFGASSAWTASCVSDNPARRGCMSEALADALFTTDGIGLTLLRIQVRPEGFTFEESTAEAAIARGARVWAAPWSPPGEWKNNKQTQSGGFLLREHYGDWADRLATFARELHDRGIPLMALSAQNEPNWTADWDTCRWSPQQLATFISDYLGPALREQGLDTKVIAPETINWGSLANYSNPLLSEPEIRQYLDAVATHSYGSSPFVYTAALSCNVEIWQTEVSDAPEATGGPRTADGSIDSGLRIARMIHDHLAIAQVSAWHYWWIRPRGDTDDSNGGILDKEDRLTRRAYVMGNWSKFARPGFVRVHAAGHPNGGLDVSAFFDPDGTRFAIVVVNQETQSATRRLSLGQALAGAVVPWITSKDFALEAQNGIDAPGDEFEYTFPARSVTTLVGELSESPTPNDAGVVETPSDAGL